MQNQDHEPPLLTVSQLTQAIKLSLESTFPFVCLQGEVSNFKAQSSGHLYFSLKDAEAQITVVMFRADASRLKVLPKGGDQVIVKGAINVYPSKGNYQLIIRELSYVGLGELLLKLEQLKIKLHQLGWFKSSRKKAIPALPKRIGVVTSPTGAVIQDILHILTRRFSGFHLILNPVKVQGEGAAQEIAEAIEQFNRYGLVDVMIVGRGGGSLEDLWAFNEEIVAAAIYNSQIPIICAVGHETDHSIAEYVADVRAPTPSAAAEMVIAEKAQLSHRLEVIRRRLQQTAKHAVDKYRHRLERFIKHPLMVRPMMLLEWRMQKIDDMREAIDQAICNALQRKRQLLIARSQQALAMRPKAKVEQLRQRLHHFEHKLQQMMALQLERRRERLQRLQATLKAIDPKNVLQRGYSILLAEKEQFIIKSVEQLYRVDTARVLLSDGEARIKIKTIPSHE